MDLAYVKSNTLISFWQVYRIHQMLFNYLRLLDETIH